MRFTSLALAAALLPLAVQAQSSTDTLSLLGRTSITAGVGLTGSHDATVGSNQTSSHASGQVASFALSHWVRPELAVEISTAVLNADATAGLTTTHSAAIVPVLFGLSVSPRPLALSTSVRPYLSVAAGPYIHMVSDVSTTRASAFTETKPGARVGAGVNWFVSRHFMTQLEGDYHAVSAFSQTDALTMKPSGFGLSVGLGFSWGGR